MGLSDQSRSDSPTRLVYIINSLHIGGAEIGMCRLLNGLDAEAYEVTVISLDGHGDELVAQLPSWVTVVDLRLKSGIRLSTLQKLWSATQSADVIVGSLIHAAITARIAGIFNRNAMIATWHHTEQFKTDVRKAVFGKTNWLSDVILADSEPVAEMLCRTFTLDEKFVHTVPIAGIDLDEFTSVEHTKSDTVTVGSVGRVTKAKNYATLLDVADRLSGQGIEFEIAGDGELLDALMEETQMRGLSNVRFHGEVTDIPEFLSTVDIYFQPSLYEGLCITVLEAMATGLPVVGSDVGGISRNVEHERSGFLFDPYDVQGYVSAIERLAADPECRAEFGKRGRQIVERSFTQDVLVEEFEKAIRRTER